MLVTEPSVGQSATAWVGARSLRFVWHPVPPGHEKTTGGFLLDGFLHCHSTISEDNINSHLLSSIGTRRINEEPPQDFSSGGPRLYFLHCHFTISEDNINSHLLSNYRGVQFSSAQGPASDTYAGCCTPSSQQPPPKSVHRGSGVQAVSDTPCYQQP